MPDRAAFRRTYGTTSKLDTYICNAQCTAGGGSDISEVGTITVEIQDDKHAVLSTIVVMFAQEKSNHSDHREDFQRRTESVP